MPPVIDVRNVSKCYQVTMNKSASIKTRFVGLFSERYREEKREHWALRNINLVVEPGESVGLIGPNGSGKSTLFKLLAGVLPPTSGEIVTNGLIAPMIELGVGFHPELTGLENIYLNTSFYGMTRAETEPLIQGIQDFSELGEFIDTPVKDYSTGMGMRLGFAIAVATAPDLLLVDEVLAVGDQHFQQKCMEQMARFRKEGRTFLFVSHSLQSVVAMCERSVLLWRGEIVADGDSASVAREYCERVADEEQAGAMSLSMTPQA